MQDNITLKPAIEIQKKPSIALATEGNIQNVVEKTLVFIEMKSTLH